MMATRMMLKMKLNEQKTIYFDKPLLNVEAIQLREMWASSDSYFIFCDIIDSNFSLTNIDPSNNLFTQSKLIGMFPRGLGEMFKTNSSIISKLTITIKKTDLTKPTKDEVVILNLKIYHE